MITLFFTNNKDGKGHVFTSVYLLTKYLVFQCTTLFSLLATDGGYGGGAAEREDIYCFLINHCIAYPGLGWVDTQVSGW